MTFKIALDKRSVDGARADGTGANALFHEIDGDGARDADDGSFAGTIGEATVDSDHASSGRDIDEDTSLRLLCNHMSDGVFGAEEDAPSIDSHNPFPVFKAGFEDIADVADARIIDEDIKASMFLYDLGKGSTYLFLMGNIKRNGLCAPILRDDLGDDLCRGLFSDVGNDDMCTLLCVEEGDLFADTGACPSNECNFVIQPEHEDAPFLRREWLS